MPGPAWSDDDPADRLTIADNCRRLLRHLSATSERRSAPTLADATEWHRRIYEGCRVPSRAYLGHFRGDADRPDLVDYEVGVGTVLADGLPEKVGVWAADVGGALDRFIGGLRAALVVLDDRLPRGCPPDTVDDLHEVVMLTAEVHGEWLRIHPFADGNGRTARVWAAYVALRYGLPAFVQLKPRPDEIAYVRAARRSMGRPPAFGGSHDETVAVFAHLLSLALRP